MTTLIIVESLTKSKAIAGYAGPGHFARATFGHIRDLPRKELGVEIENDFKPHYHITNRKTVKVLREAIGRADTVVLAADPDREGEAIAWHVTQVLRKELKGKQVVRATFHEITPQAVREALAHPRQIDRNLVDAQQARRILDRLVGYTISPVLWRNVRGPAGLSAGRVQTAALRLVVERDREIAAFVPEEYWTLDAELSKRVEEESGEKFLARLTKVGKEKADLKTEADAHQVIEDLEGADYSVIGVRRERKRRNPPPPYTTSVMQRDAANRLGWTPKKTMQVAQGLFEGLELPGEGHVGLITYMRTDSTHVAPEAQEQARRVIADLYGDEALPEKPPVHKTKAKLAQEAHEAIRPTSAARLPERINDHLSDDQAKLYELIWRRFLASQMKPAVYDVTTVEVEAQGQSGTTYRFRATGRKMLEPGFLVVYGDPGDDRMLPILEKGDPLICHRLIPEQHFTEPPPHFTESSLIKELERRGIGRPSTYAAIVATIQTRQYVEKRGKSLWATEVGFRVCDFLVERFPDIFDLGFTARMEERLDEIASGRAKWKAVLREFWMTLAPRLEA